MIEPRMMMKAVAALMLAAPVYAQLNTASVTGQVVDSSGALVAGATVTARALSTNTERTSTTDGEGNYFLSSLALGPYRLAATAPGFKTAVRDGIVLSAGDRVRLDLTLSPGELTESITVSGEAPIVNATSPELGVLIDSQKVENLPLNGRNFTDLVRLQPGVQAQNVGGRTSFVLNGSSQWGLNITLDGTDSSFIETPSFGYQDQRALITTVSLDSIQEFRVQTGAFTAETGRASGGAVNVITKSGTNQFHGSLFEYFRNDALDATNFFANRAGIGKAKRRQNQFGGSLGGPILRDRLFFFGNYEGARLRIGEQIVRNVPTAQFRSVSPAVYKPFFDLVPLPTEPIVTNGVVNQEAGVHRRNDDFIDDENLYNIRGDYQTASSMTSLRYSLNKTKNSQAFLLPASRREWPAANHLASIGNTWTVNPAAVNELRLGFNRWYLPRRTQSYEGGLGEIAVPGILPGGYNNEGILRWASNSYTLADNFTYRAGRHGLKTGFEIRRIVSGRIQRSNPTYTYNSTANFLANRPERVNVQFGQPGADMRQTQTGIFLQDDFQVNSRLVLNMGLRWEYYTPFNGNGVAFNIEDDPFGPFAKANAQIYGKDLNNFNPRFGFAYDVAGKQRTILRGGIGIYTSPLPAWGLWGLASIDPRLPFSTMFAQTDIPGGLAFPISGDLLAAFENPSEALELGFLPAVVQRRVVDTNLRDTYSILYNLSLEQQIANGWAVRASYVGNGTRKSYTTRVLNLPDPALGGRRPAPAIANIEMTENAGRRGYHALQVSLLSRRSRGLTTDLHYTWGNNIVYGNDDCCSGGTYVVQDQDNIAGSRGPARVDLRHQFTGSFSYELPFRFNRKWAKTAFADWAIQGIVQVRTGPPVNILSGRDTRGNSFSGSQRADYAGGSQYLAEKTVDGWLRRDAYAFPATGRFGNIGYNTARAPGLFNLDLSLQKSFALTETLRLQFRADSFNATNRANFGAPVSALSDANFGRIVSASDPRIIQLSLRLQF